MRVILHAGLHKTGTSSVQATWARTFAEPRAGGVWYPAPLTSGPGHANVAWWARDLTLAAAHQPLPGVLQLAEQSDVATVLLSSEEFDRCDRRAAHRLHVALHGHEVTIVLTVTPPVHRFPAAWQEMVKHGFVGDQVDGRDEIAEFATLSGRGVEALVDDLGVSAVVVRIVRPLPPEQDLAQEVLRAVGVDQKIADPGTTATTNTTIGHVEAHLLRSLNALHPGGVLSPPGRALLEALRQHQGWRSAVPLSKVGLDQRLWDFVRDKADEERERLRALSSSGRARVHDPSDLLDRWDVTRLDDLVTPADAPIRAAGDSTSPHAPAGAAADITSSSVDAARPDGEGSP